MWGRTHETNLGISMDIDGKKYSGGLTGALDNKNSITAVASIGNNRRVMVKFKWRYMRQRRVCMHNSMTLAYNTHDYRWVPKDKYGGNRIDDTTADFSCSGTGPVYNDWFGLRTTVTRESAVTYNGFFKVNGVTLNARQLDRDAQKYTVAPDSGVNAKVCGNNDGPLYADLAKEVPS